MKQPVGRIVNARGLGCDSVELDYLEVPSHPEIFDRFCADIVASEIKAGETLADFIDRLFQLFRLVLNSFQEQRASAMRPKLHQFQLLSVRQNVSQPILVVLQMKTSHTYGAII